LASERLAGTLPHLCEGKAESTRQEEKPRATSVRRSREYSPRGEAMNIYLKEKPKVSSLRGNCESPAQNQKIYIKDNLVNLILVFLVPVVRTITILVNTHKKIELASHVQVFNSLKNINSHLIINYRLRTRQNNYKIMCYTISLI